jgi:hypothetical protein
MAGPAGFKIADGYVEVHARYDKGELEKAAQAAADDHDKAFNKERIRNSQDSSSRDTNRKVGGQAGADFIKGMREQIDRDRDKPIISVDRVKTDASRLARVHVAAFEQENDRQAPRWRNLGKRISQRIGTGLVGRDGAGSAAGAFVTRFVESVTLGMADLKSSRIAGPMGAKFAAIGTGVGLTLATFLIAKAGEYITAATPLLLGALAIIPIKFLAKTDKQVKASIKGLKSEWKDFMGFVSDPIRPGLLKALDNIKDGLNGLRGPVARFFKAIGDALPALSKGGMQALENFFRAIGNESVTAGLKEWGKQLPGIGTALGKMITKILQDPETTIRVVKDVTQDLITLAHAAGSIVSGLTQIALAWDKMSTSIDRFENSTSKEQGGPLGGMWNAIKRNAPKIVAEIGGLGDRIAAKIQGWQGKITAKAKEIGNGIVAAFKSLPGKVGEALAKLKASFSSHMQQIVTSGKARAKQAVDGVVGFFKGLPGKAASAVSSLWSRMSGAFSKAVTNGRAKATDLVSRVTSSLKTLPGKAASAVSSLWSRMTGSFSKAVTGARAKAVDLVNRFIAALKALPGKAGAEAGRVKSAILSKFAGAGAWLVSAGRSIITGLANGIRAGASAAISAAASVARSALAAAKSALKIASPSKVFAEEVGKPIAQGIGLGMKKNIPEEFKELPGMLPTMRAPKTSSPGPSKSYSSTFSPNLVINSNNGLNELGAANRRALVRDIFLALESYRKDYAK